MDWIETPDFPAARRRLMSRVELRPSNVTIYVIGAALIATVGLWVASARQHKSVMWDMLIVLALICGTIGGLGYAGTTWAAIRRRAGRQRRIRLNAASFTVTQGAIHKTLPYGDFVGYSIFDEVGHMPGNGLLVFGEATGRNVSVGIPHAVAVDRVRGFLQSKLRELPNDQLPKPKSPLC